jgi:hypothetical protein
VRAATMKGPCKDCDHRQPLTTATTSFTEVLVLDGICATLSTAWDVGVVDVAGGSVVSARGVVVGVAVAAAAGTTELVAAATAAVAAIVTFISAFTPNCWTQEICGSRAATISTYFRRRNSHSS